MASVMTKISHRFTLNGAPLVGYTVSVTFSGGNSPARLFADAAGVGKLPTNKLLTDADGVAAAYVAAGTYRLALLAPGNNATLSLVDPVIPNAEGVRVSEGGVQAKANVIAYAASITPAISDDITVLQVGAMTGNPAINAPAGTIANQVGKILIVNLLQDGVGSRAPTWNAIFKKTADAAGAAGQRGSTMFVCDGVAWNQVGGALTYR